MTKIYTLLALTFALFLSACSPEPDSSPQPTSLLVGGKYTVINYWAEWCKPCREEIPELNALASQYAKDVVVYGINFDGVNGEALIALSDEFGIEYPSADISLAQKLGIPRPIALPTTVIFDPEGKQIRSLVGPQTTESLAKFFATKN